MISEIKDEYDVQDLLNALLRLNFDDVRPEEYTPSYAGSSTRVDFLLKKEKIVIEVKKTRKVQSIIYRCWLSNAIAKKPATYQG